MQVADWLLLQLNKLKVKHVFLVPGGEIDPLVSALGAQQSILSHHCVS